MLPRMPKRKDGSTVDWAQPILEAWDCSEAAALSLLEAFCKEGAADFQYVCPCARDSSSPCGCAQLQFWPSAALAAASAALCSQGILQAALSMVCAQVCSTTSRVGAMQMGGRSHGSAHTCAGASSAPVTCTSASQR